MTKKTNWLYYYSKALNMRYAVHSETGDLMTEDKITYSFKEIKILNGAEITPQIHKVKKVFKGEIIA